MDTQCVIPFIGNVQKRHVHKLEVETEGFVPDAGLEGMGQGLGQVLPEPCWLLCVVWHHWKWIRASVCQ